MRLELNRRKFLQLAGVAALGVSAAALTGCGGGGGSSKPENPDQPNNPDKPDQPDQPGDVEDPDNEPEKSNPEETDGIVWVYRKTSDTTATLLGVSSSGKIPSGDVVLPSVINELEITKIETSAFKGKTWTSVDIPETVQVIRETAFLGCSSLTSVTLHEGLTSIQKGAFASCGLTSASIPASVTSFGSGVFDNCSHLESLQFLGDPSFAADPIGEVTSLHKVSLAEGFTTIVSEMFSECTSLEQINFPSTLKRIGASAFYNCLDLKIDVVLPDGLTELGTKAFYESGITSLTTSLANIPAEAFAYCTELRSVTLQKGVTTIGENAFYRSSCLWQIEFPDGLTRIGEHAFDGCNLETIRLPDSVSIVEQYAFNSCGATTIRLPKTMKEIGAFAFAWNLPASIIVPEDITIIHEGAFAQSLVEGAKNQQTQTLYLPGSVRTIEKDAFLFALNPTIGEIYFSGSQGEWDRLVDSLPGGNDCIRNCTRVHCPATRDQAEGYNFLSMF